MDQSNFNFLWRGLIIGLTIAAPIGPISILCIQRSITKGFFSGFISGLGAATGDAIYAYIGAHSLDLIEANLIVQRIWFCLTSGIFLCYLGVKIFLTKSAIYNDKANSLLKGPISGHELFRDYVSTLLINSISPMTIVLFAVVFAGLNTATIHPTRTSISVFAVGIFIGSVGWSTFLSGIANRFTEGFNARQLQWINRISGITITAFGLVSMLDLSKFSLYE